MIRAIAAALLIVVLLVLLSSVIVTMAWNAVIPYLFGLPTLDIGQSIWLMILIWSLGLGTKGYASVSNTDKK